MRYLLLISFFVLSQISFAQDNVDEQIKFDFNELLSTINFTDNISKEDGKVVVKVFVERSGNVSNVELISAGNKKLAENIIKSIKDYKKFTPARKNGQFVDSWIKIPFVFSEKEGKVTRFYNANPESELIELDKTPGVDLAKLMSLVKYPEDAYNQKIEGKVIASVLIDESGKAEEVKIISSDNIIFNTAAINAINEYGIFTPAEKDDKKVKSWVSIPFSFVYQDKPKVEEKKKDGKLVNAKIDLTKLQKNVKYPKDARAKEVEGKVVLKVLVNEKGKFVDIQVEHTDNEMLNEAAIKAVKDYGKAEKAATLDGKATASWIYLPIQFKLK